MRILIGGGPKTGKTTSSQRLAAELGVEAQHTDDLIGKLDWSAASAEVSTWFAKPGPWIIEGVAVARALRKWIAAHPLEKPCDMMIHLIHPLVKLSDGQETMRKGCIKVWKEVESHILALGIPVRLMADQATLACFNIGGRN